MNNAELMLKMIETITDHTGLQDEVFDAMELDPVKDDLLSALLEYRDQLRDEQC